MGAGVGGTGRKWRANGVVKFQIGEMVFVYLLAARLARLGEAEAERGSTRSRAPQGARRENGGDRRELRRPQSSAQ